MARVVLENLTKVFADGITAVDHLNLEVRDGELLALVGPSGCGKTTTLRLIAGLERPHTGSIAIDGRDVTALPPWRRHVAMTFQDAALYPHLRVAGNLAFGLRLKKMPRRQIEQRVREVADLLGITDLLMRRCHALSGGQQRRVALGRALVHEAHCTLLDEPLSHLDVSSRRVLRERICALHRHTGRTMIYVTHDQEEAMAVGERIAVLRDGKLQQCGPALTVYRRPANRFVATFIGSAPMNLFRGTLAASNEAFQFDDGHLQLTLPDAIKSHFDVVPTGNIVLGFRPEALRPCRDDASIEDLGSQRPITMRLVVEAVEPLGDRVDVRLATDGPTTVLARLPADQDYTPGQPLALAIDPKHLHFFADDESGANLSS